MLDTQIAKAAALLEALPYMQAFRGQTFLIKVGGSAMEDPELVRKLLRDIVFLEACGVKPVIVHGGGKAISAAMAEADLEPEFVGGLRRTSADAIGIVEKTLSGTINPSLVDFINEHGGHAVGVPGHHVFRAKRKEGIHPETGGPVDLGFVGEICGFDTAPIDDALAAGAVPVLSPLGLDEATGDRLNVNADLAASPLAGHLGAAKLIYLSDVRGVLHDPAENATLIPHLDESSISTLIARGTIGGGMVPKVNSALQALRDGVGKVHLIDGRIPHSLIIEVFTDTGIGTEIVLGE